MTLKPLLLCLSLRSRAKLSNVSPIPPCVLASEILLPVSRVPTLHNRERGIPLPPINVLAPMIRLPSSVIRNLVTPRILPPHKIRKQQEVIPTDKLLPVPPKALIVVPKLSPWVVTLPGTCKLLNTGTSKEIDVEAPVEPRLITIFDPEGECLKLKPRLIPVPRLGN